MPRWCAESWCWVDANECTDVATAPTASSYFAHAGSSFVFSYETCNSENVFSDFYAEVMAPKPPPPTPPTAPPPYAYEREIGLGSTGGAIVLIALLIFIQNRLLTKSIKSKQRKAVARETIQAALETTGRMRYTASFVRANDFLELGTLQPHEELRNRGKLVYRDSFDELAQGGDYTIFISQCASRRQSPANSILLHPAESLRFFSLSSQWTSFQLPDPSGEQYAVMCAAVRRIAEEKLPPDAEGDRQEALKSLLGRILVWVE